MADELNMRREAIAREVHTIREGLDRLAVPSVEALPAAAENAEKEAAVAAEAEKNAEAARRTAQELLNLNNDFAELDKRRENRDNAKKAAEGDRGLQARLDMAVKAEKARNDGDREGTISEIL